MAEAAKSLPVPNGVGATEATPIPFKMETKSFVEQGGEVLLVTFLLLAVALAVLLWVKKRLGISRSGDLETADTRLSVLKKMGTGTQSSLIVVRWRRKEYLLAQTANSITRIDEIAVDGATEASQQVSQPD